MRSPNYPAYGLTEALRMANTLWAKENRTVISSEIAAKALGYKALSGPVRMKLSTLKKFGLLEELSTGGVRLSELAIALVHHAPDSPEHDEALHETALRPDLFRELYDSHLKASDDAIRSHLIVKKAFSEAGARQAIAAFRDTISVAKLNGAGYNSGGVEKTPMLEASPVPPKPQPVHQAATINVGLRQDVFSLAEGPVTIQWPASLSPESYQDLGDWLDIVKRKIGRSVETKEH